MRRISYILLFCFCLLSCKERNSQASTSQAIPKSAPKTSVVVGAARIDQYLPLVAGKRVALLTNQTGRVGNRSTAAYLKSKGVNVTLILTPEHGLSGKAAPGVSVGNSVDAETGVPVYSLYKGGFTPPGDKEMNRFDVLLSDMQDVGVRFYTYYISMVRMMDVCADYHKKMIVLDRPNPNGHYVDGPVLDMKYKSEVGWLPIPVVYGMTMGELALMVNGEHWLADGRYCELRVVTCLHYTHHTLYILPVSPSPNLPNMRSVYLYPSLCLFEGTQVSVGRGTSTPFQSYGVKAQNYWTDLSKLTDKEAKETGFSLNYLVEAYHKLHQGDKFFTPFFEKLIGVGYVRKMVMDGKAADQIQQKWEPDVERFKKLRKEYLLYKE
jgi:uncharacterized protein YbbC (DUF1343 family)